MNRKTAAFFLFFVYFSGTAFSVEMAVPVSAPAASYPYESLPDDPMRVRIYTLGNGLKVYTSVYKNEPRISTVIAVKAGTRHETEKNESAHILEHMLFKGTDKIGAVDYAKEEPLLQKIEELSGQYAAAQDDARKKKIYTDIDAVSQEAARYAAPTEYTKLMSMLGATQTNATVRDDGTTFVNNIPSNQLEAWLIVEAERFRKPILRSFFSELETIHEELNHNMDDGFYVLTNFFFRKLFRDHPYGRSIFVVPEIEKASVQKVRNFYERYYVPGNMAVCLAGDFDPDEAVRLVDRTFGKLPARPVPVSVKGPADPIQKPREKEIAGPLPDQMAMGFKFSGLTEDASDFIYVQLVDGLLNYPSGGLIPVNLTGKKNAVFAAQSQITELKDHIVHTLYGSPNEGQPQKEVKKLLLDQLKAIKKGAFSGDLFAAVVNNIKFNDEKMLENTYMRADFMADSFVWDTPWAVFIGTTARQTTITKKELVRFARRNYRDNYALVYLRNDPFHKLGKRFAKKSLMQTTPAAAAESAFYKSIAERPPPPGIEPVFLDYTRDIQTTRARNIPVYYVHNKENKIFNLYHSFPFGRLYDKRLLAALEHSYKLALSSPLYEKEFHRLGCELTFYAQYDDHFYVMMTGLEENFEPAAALLYRLFSEVAPDENVWRVQAEWIIKSRMDEYPIPGGMRDYTLFGPRYLRGREPTDSQLRSYTSRELTEFIRPIFLNPQHILYYGTAELEEVARVLETYAPARVENVAPQKTVPDVVATDKKNIYAAKNNYEQEENLLMIFSRKGLYNAADIPMIHIYNEYMRKEVFNEMRESSGLVYSAQAALIYPFRPDQHGYFHAYFKTNASKTRDALTHFLSLIAREPASEASFLEARQNVLERMKTERITKLDLLFNFEEALFLKEDHDIRKDVYLNVPKITFEDFKRFQREWVKDQSYTISIVGQVPDKDLKALKKFGNLRFLNGKDIFGY